MNWYPLSQKIVTGLETAHSLYKPESTFKKQTRIFKGDYFITTLGALRNVLHYFILQIVLSDECHTMQIEKEQVS